MVTLVMTLVLGHRLTRAHIRDAGRNIARRQPSVLILSFWCGQWRCASTGRPVAEEKVLGVIQVDV